MPQTPIKFLTQPSLEAFQRHWKATHPGVEIITAEAEILPNGNMRIRLLCLSAEH